MGDRESNKPSINFSFSRVYELEFSRRIIPELFEDGFDVSEIKTAINLDANSGEARSTINIVLDIGYVFLRDNGKPIPLLKYKSLTEFEVSEFDLAVKNGEFIEHGFFEHLVEIATHMARGAIATKTEGHYLSEFPLPLINTQLLALQVLNPTHVDDPQN